MSTNNADTPFSPRNALEHALHAGDFEATLNALDAMNEEQRARVLSPLLALYERLHPWRWEKNPAILAYWGQPVSDAHFRALSAATFVCGTTGPGWLNDDEIVRLAKRYGPDKLPALRSAQILRRARVIGQLVQAGLIERPDDEQYILGLIALPERLRKDEQLFDVIMADPGLIDGPLLRVFEIEGHASCSLADLEKYRGSRDAGLSWQAFWLKAAEKGLVARTTLLDKTLGALERDWPQFRSGWFSRFHVALAPSVAEMAPFAKRYLGLCYSRIPPTVAFAVKILEQLDTAQALDAEPLLASLARAMSGEAKSLLKLGFKLLDRVVSRSPEQARSAARSMAPALLHADADIQKNVLKRLADRGMAEDTRAFVLECAPQIAASNRAALAALLPETDATKSTAPAPAPSIAGDPTSPLAPERALPPIADLDTLTETIAFVLENDSETDALERVLEALPRMAPLDAEQKRALKAVTKRARKAKKPVATELARLLIFVVDGEPLPHVPWMENTHHLLADRVDDLIACASSGARLPPLSSATHAGGFIDPENWIARVGAYLARSQEPPLNEAVRGLLRLYPVRDPALIAAARSLPETSLALALRYALGDDVGVGPEQALYLAAARIRYPGADDPVCFAAYGDQSADGALAVRYTWGVYADTDTPGRAWLRVTDTPQRPGDEPTDLIATARHARRSSTFGSRSRLCNHGGTDEGLVNYFASLLPSSLDLFFASGAQSIADNLSWSEAQWYLRAYLKRLLDPTVELTPMATLTLALGLAEGEAGRAALAVDAALSADAEGRLNRAQLATTLRDLVKTPLVLPARLAKTLGTLARARDGAAMLAFDLLAGMLALAPTEVPRNLTVLLTLLRELALITESPLPNATATLLAGFNLSGKAKTLRDSLLAESRARIQGPA